MYVFYIYAYTIVGNPRPLSKWGGALRFKPKFQKEWV